MDQIGPFKNLVLLTHLTCASDDAEVEPLGNASHKLNL